MDELKAHYRAGLPARIKALEGAARGLAESQPDAMASVRRLAHTLRGSGGTYGFPEITKAADAVEHAPDGEVAPLTGKLLEVLRETAWGGGGGKSGILVVDDDPAVLVLMKESLAAPNREIFVTHTGMFAEKILEERPVSLLLLDIVLPDIDGRTLLMRLRERPATAALPVVIISSLAGTHTKTECFALGADEFFEKPVDPDLLGAVVAAKLERAAQISRESRQDALTGLLNRAGFHEAFGRARAYAARNQQPLSFALLDVDNLKSVNDAHGPKVGDDLLKHVASVILGALRKSDLFARWGADEFAVLLPDTDLPGAGNAVSKALDVVRARPFEAPGGATYPVAFCAGLAAVGPEAALEEVAAGADHLLSLAKSSGRGRVLTSAEGVASQRRRIVLAEDDDLIASVVKHRLAREGYEVVHYGDGASALAAAESDDDVTMFILDVKMPEMDGFELLQRLRALPAFERTPILMLTSMGSERDIVRGLKLGADDYILKPFSPAELLARVTRHGRK